MKEFTLKSYHGRGQNDEGGGWSKLKKLANTLERKKERKKERKT